MTGNITTILNEDETVSIIGKQGATWSFEIALQNDDGTSVDLSGYSARGQIRKTYASADIEANFNCEIKSPQSFGKIAISIAASVTAGIAAYRDNIDPSKLKKISALEAGVYVYDIEIFTGTPEEVSRILEGKLYIDPEATK